MVSNHSAAVAGALFREQHVHELVGVVTGIDRQLYQPTGARVDGGLAQLRGVHLAQSLEARDRRPGARALLGDFCQGLIALHIVQGVMDLFARIDAIQRGMAT